MSDDAQLVENLTDALMDARQMLEQSEDAIMVLDDDRRYLAMNRAAAEMLRRAPHAIIGRTVEAVFGLDDHARAELDNVWALLLADGRLRIDWPMELPDGTQVVLDVAATASYRPGRHLTIMRDVTATRRDQAALVDREQRLEYLLEAIERMRDTERRSMADAIHDHSLQHLLATRMTLELGSGLDGHERDAMHDRARALLDGAIASTRDLLQGISPVHTEHRSLGAMLAAGILEVGQVHGSEVAVDLELPLQVAAQSGNAVMRVVAEGVSNACRHASAHNVSVWGRLEGSGDVVVRIVDDGCGFDPSAVATGREGIGLQLMQERVRALQGTVEIDSEPGRGTNVTLRIPGLSPVRPAGTAQ